MVEDYVGICRLLPFEDLSVFMDAIDIVKRNIEMWSLENSPVYLRSRPYYSKEHMEDRSLWYVDEAMADSVETHTSGSTTGFHFIYRRMISTFERLEWDNHYDLVMDEFGVADQPDLLYFFPNHFEKRDGMPVFLSPEPQPYLNSHGRSRRCRVHYANFDLYKSDPFSFFSALFEYVSRNRIDVVFSAGPQINSMCYHMRKLGFSGRFARLLSQTNERMLQDDASFLLSGNYFDFICDHMRCWDGGASFFTCRHGNYHLMDNLSWCEDIDGKMISTDYFNLASPFVRYWNGDMCKIGSDFMRCECGRLYREFEFLENRPFSLNGVCLGDLRRRMLLLGVGGVKQVKCYVDKIDIVSSRTLSENEKFKISDLEPSFSFFFSVEEE
jgi:hypothetical protein